jgi:hypothetical protein
VSVPLITARGPGQGELGEPLWPAVDDELAIRFEPGETLRWRGRAQVSESRLADGDDPESDFDVWCLSEADIIITDRRIAYAGQSLDPDRIGPGAKMTAAARAAYRTLPQGGAIMVGHLRFDWLARVVLRKVTFLMRGAVLSLCCGEGTGRTRLVIPLFGSNVGKPAPLRAAELSHALAGDIARSRGREPPDPFRHERGLLFDLPGWVPIGAAARRPAQDTRRLNQPAIHALRLAAEEAGDRPVLTTQDLLVGACRIELERWAPLLVRVELSVEGLRAGPGRPEAPATTRVDLLSDPDVPAVTVTAEVADAMQLAEQIALRYGFETVAPAHLALAIALHPKSSGAAVLTSRGAEPGAVVAALSETLFDADFDDLDELRDDVLVTARLVSPALEAPAPQPPAPEAPTARPAGKVRIAFVERVGVIALALIVLLVLASFGGLRSTTSAARDLERGHVALHRGDHRNAVRAWQDVLMASPGSLKARLLLSCTLWDIGYVDDAVQYYQQALVEGLPWNTVVTDRRCWLNDPTGHRLRLRSVQHVPVLYVRPGDKDRDGVALHAILAGGRADAPHHPLPAESMLAAACLNDRADLRLLAAIHMTLALNDPALPRLNGVLLRCATSFKGRYRFQVRAGQEIFFPADRDERTFWTSHSPIPAHRPRPLQ